MNKTVKTTVAKFFSWYFDIDMENTNIGEFGEYLSDIIDDEQGVQFDPGDGDFEKIVTNLSRSILMHKYNSIEVETGHTIGGHYAKFSYSDGSYGMVNFNLDCMDEYNG